jgi:DNA polymerase III alpha subunit
MKVKILKPDVNKSFKTFSMEGKDIRFGLNSIMTVQNVAENIINERNLNGDFKSPVDFCQRTKVNKKVIENLMYSGAFSSFGEIAQVYNELIQFAPNLDELIVEPDELAVRELKVLGTNITFQHSLLKNIGYYECLADISDGQTGSIVVNIAKIESKATKKKKPYTLFKCIDVKSSESFNCFDWSNNEQKHKTGDFVLFHIARDGDFITLRELDEKDRLKRYYVNKKKIEKKELEEKERKGESTTTTE